MKKETVSTASFEQEDGIAKIDRFIREKTASYRAEEIPIGNDGRIDMQAYAHIHPDLWKDLARNREWEGEWFSGLTEDEIKEKRRQMEGERLEMLTQAIFTKYLLPEKDFVVARASSHDDRVNKVDTIILDRKTGALVCAFDEVGATNGVDYEKKQAGVQEINIRKGGASLKYGIGIEPGNNKGKIVLTSASNIPVFYIALPPDRIKKGIAEFVPDAGGKSEFEERLFDYFVATIVAQIQGLELYKKRLNPALVEKLSAFKRIMESRRRKA